MPMHNTKNKYLLDTDLYHYVPIKCNIANRKYGAVTSTLTRKHEDEVSLFLSLSSLFFVPLFRLFSFLFGAQLYNSASTTMEYEPQDDPHKLTIVFSLSERGRSTPMNTCCPTVSATCPTSCNVFFTSSSTKHVVCFYGTGRLLPSRLSQALLLAPPPTTNTQQTKQNIVV